jgi:hypothetical protein
MPNGWFADDSIIVTQHNDTVYEGNFCAKIKLITQNQTFADFYSQKVKVTPGREYTFSIRIWDNDFQGKARLVIWWKGASPYYGNYSNNVDEWQLLSATKICPQEVDSASVGLRFYDVASSWDGDAIFYIDSTNLVCKESNNPPIITFLMHRPTNPGEGECVILRAKIIDDSYIIGDTLYYDKGMDTLVAISHDSVVNNIYYYHINELPTGTINSYYIKAWDDSGAVGVSHTKTYLTGKLSICINEIYYDSPGADVNCFIELKGKPGLAMTNYLICGVNGKDGDTYNVIHLDGLVIPQDSYLVIAQDTFVTNFDTITTKANMQNGPDNIELRYNGIVIDAVGYGDFTNAYFTGEWEEVEDVSNGLSLSRIPDGVDTDLNNIDFRPSAPTPGTTNTIGIEESSIPTIRNLKIPTILTSNFKIPVPQGTKVYDLLGRCIQKLTSQGELNLSPHYAQGIYFIKYSTSTAKIIILK